MKLKIRKLKIAAVLICAFVAAGSLTYVNNHDHVAVQAKTISDLEDEKAANEAEIKRLQEEMDSIDSDISQAEKDQELLQEKINLQNENIEIVNTKINDINNKIAEKEEKINQNFNIDDKSDMESLLKYVTDDVIKLPLEQKRQMLIRDESFETIRSISNNAFEMAQEAYTSKSDNIDETKVDEMQKKLNELLKSVKAFNKQQAIWLVSEGILDLNFVKNPKTDIMSIRLGRCLQSK